MGSKERVGVSSRAATVDAVGDGGTGEGVRMLGEGDASLARGVLNVRVKK